MDLSIVCIVDDDPMVRQSIALLIETLGVRTIVYASAREFLDDPCMHHCACLVLDVRMPGMGGLELQRRLASDNWTAPIIFITGHGDVQMAVEAIRGGAIDFLQKPFRDQALLDRVQQALEQHPNLIEKKRRMNVIHARIELLTKREREVARLLLAGKMNKGIATELGIGIKTVEDHRASIMQKMHACSFADLVLMFAEAGQA